MIYLTLLSASQWLKFVTTVNFRNSELFLCEDVKLAAKSTEQVQNTGPQDFRPIRGFIAPQALHAPTARECTAGAFSPRLRHVYYCYTMQWHQSKQGMYCHSVGGDPPHPPSFF